MEAAEVATEAAAVAVVAEVADPPVKVTEVADSSS